MFPRWWRLGIRPQLTIIVILAAILSTAATLFIADNAIQNYVLQQAQAQELDNMKIARLVLTNQYGANISIASDNTMVADTPGTGRDLTLNQANNFGKYVLNGDTDFVDEVNKLIGGSVAIYQCADSHGNFTRCLRVATTASSSGRKVGNELAPDVSRSMNLETTPRDWQGVNTIDGVQTYADYSPIFNPQQQLIGILVVAVPLNSITTLVSHTTVELVLIGTIIMVAAVILALFFANAIISTLQRAARQVNGASERIGSIAAQQSSGSAQQVWAINAINQALQNFSETARDISQRTDQLALMGNQVLQRRSEISPTQIDSILAYITRSVRDISVASRQQASQYERMTGAMQAVIEIAEQVAGNSQQASESSERLELVVRQLQQLVGVRQLARTTTSEAAGLEQAAAEMNARQTANDRKAGGTVRAVRPARPMAPGMSTGFEANGAGMGMGGVPMSAGMGMAGGNGAGMMGGPGQYMGQMPVSAGTVPGAEDHTGGFGGMNPAAGMGRMPLPGQMSGGMPGMTNVRGGGMRPPMQNEMRPAPRAALPPMSGGDGNPPGNMDWRLPPMPEMPPMPDFDRGQMPSFGQGMPDPNAGRFSGPGRAPASQRWGGSGPERSNPNSGGW
ncbi:MAG TPA: cache domain-containing protein [Ktedonobacterales bacterium]|nr:cache domain-containing protein [Ktedonobacterales bacterium]